jgi:DNA-binding NtrC family response regulator
MHKDMPCLLLLEDDTSQSKYYTLLLTEAGFNIKAFTYFEDAVDALDEQEFDAFVLDLQIDIREMKNRDAGGDTFMKIALKKYPDAPVAIISGFFDNSWGSRLTRLFMETTSCFYAHIEKPGELQLMDWAKKVLSYYRLKHPAKGSYHSEDVRVRRIVDDLIPVVASSSLPVFLIGETGTGKEGIARLIHNHPDNPFRKGPFVAVNCAAVNDELLLSELFGHVHGAYTGAHTHRLGLFLEASGWKYKGGHKSKMNVPYPAWLESCNGDRIKYAAMANEVIAGGKMLMNNLYNITDKPQGEYIFADTTPGTLFLDEIGDLTPAAEAALLRALDGYGIRPLGYTGPALLPHCSIIAATNQIMNTSDLRDVAHATTSSKGIRKELYHRLAGWVLELPPLKDRKMKDGTPEWIISLEKWAARDGLHFQDGELEYFAQTFTEDKRGKIWDGNWRELRYFYSRAKALAKHHNGGNIIRKEDLDFAGKWVLLDDLAVDNDPCSIKNIPKDQNDSYDVTFRLDCILAVDYAFRECKDDTIDMSKINFSTLGICNEAMDVIANKTLLNESVKAIQEAGRITNTAIDLLLDKKAALRSWWKNNATQTVAIINGSNKYKPIIGIVGKLSPTNFYIDNGKIEINSND